jgi:AraC family transcriptional regulator
MQALEARVEITPAEVAKRHPAQWRGLSAEIVQFTGLEPFEYEYRSRRPLLVACERGIRVAGDTRVDGLASSSLRDLARKMCLVPAGHRFSGSFVPRVLPRTTYFYLDPDALPIDPDLDFADVIFQPRLFFHDPALWATAEKLIALIDAPGGHTRLYAETLIALLAVELVQLQRGTPAPVTLLRGGLAAWQKRVVCEYIEEHLVEEIPLARLAALARLSHAHFCRAFKRSMGVSPHHYQIQRRIERAKAMLAEPRWSVAEIGTASGFVFASSFSQAFRRVTGVTPSQFRGALE